MNLRDLRYLVAVADELHFGRAARECNVSQPTLSAQLRKLEDYLGVQLVERDRRNVRVTEIGAEIVARARVVIHGADDIVALARQRQDPLSGRLRLGLIPTVGPYLLPWIAAALHEALPRVKLELYEDRTAGLLARIDQGELDAAILALPVAEGWAHTERIYREPFLLALPHGHPLTRHRHVRPEQLESEAVLLLEEGHCLRDQALDVCHRVSARERSDFQATSLETLRHMVAVGAGITLLPALAVSDSETGSSGVVIRPLVAPPPERVIGAVWRRGSARAVAVEAMVEVIRGAMATVPGVSVVERSTAAAVDDK